MIVSFSSLRRVILGAIALVSCVCASTVHAGVLSTNMTVKLLPSGSYTTTLSNVSNSGSQIQFRMQVLTSGGGGSHTYGLGFPTWFDRSALSMNIRRNTCVSYATVDPSGGQFSFSEQASGLCIVDVEFSFTLRPTTASNTYSIGFLSLDGGSDTTLSTVDIGVSAANTVTKAEALDMNRDGYIDTVRLTFGSAVVASTFNTGGLTVGPVTPTYSGSYLNGAVQYLSIPDGVYRSGDNQQLTVADNGSIFAGAAPVSITPEDMAPPELLSINGRSPTSSISLSSTGDIVLGFSEQLDPSSTGAFSLSLVGSGLLPTVNSFQNPDIPDTLLVHPFSALHAGSYTLTSDTNAKDWSNNANTLSSLFVGISVADIVSPIGLPIGSSTGISIDGGNTTTHTLSVDLTLSASDDNAVADMWISNSSSFVDGAWEPYATSKLGWTLSGTSDGSRTIYVRYRDYAHNISPTYSSSILYGSGYDYATFSTPDILYTSWSTIALSGICNSLSGSTVLVFSTETGTQTTGSCVDRAWTHTYPLVSNTVNHLGVVYADEPTVSGSLTITQSNAGVSGSIVIGSHTRLTKDRGVVLTLSASSPVGIRRMLLGGDIESGDLGWQSYSATKQVYLTTGDGTKTISVEYEDNALNTSLTYTASIRLDATPPVVTISPNGGSHTGALTVTLSSDEVAAIYYNINDTVSEPTASGTYYTWPFTVSHSGSLTVQAVDGIGNISTKQTVTFTINTAPTPPPTPTPTPTPHSSSAGWGGGWWEGTFIFPWSIPSTPSTPTKTTSTGAATTSTWGMATTGTGATPTSVATWSIAHPSVQQDTTVTSFSGVVEQSVSEGIVQTRLTSTRQSRLISSSTLSGAYLGILPGTTITASDTWDHTLTAPEEMSQGHVESLGYRMYSVGSQDPIALSRAIVIALPTNLPEGTAVAVSAPIGLDGVYVPIAQAHVRGGQIIFFSQALGTLMVGPPTGETVRTIDSSTFPIVAPPPVQPLDIEDSFARSYIETLTASGVVHGYDDGTFRPDAPASRAEFLKMVFKGLGIPVIDSQTTVFVDVQEPWQIPLAEEAHKLGIVSWQTDNEGELIFRPDDSITRAEALKILFMAEGIKSDATETVFTDLTSTWQVPIVQKAYNLGVVAGQSDKNGLLIFRPNDPITRAELSKILVETLAKR